MKDRYKNGVFAALRMAAAAHHLLPLGTILCVAASVAATLIPPLPQFSCGTSSITTKVEAGFLFSTLTSRSVVPAISSAFCSSVAPAVMRMYCCQSIWLSTMLPTLYWLPETQRAGVMP